MSNINAPTRVGLLKLLELSHGNQYVIPVYQRKYTWTANKEIKQYLNDLEKIVNKEYINHFMGIIIQLDTNIGIGKVESSVVDGQQRLTTIFLTLYAVKYLLEKNGDIASANLIDSKYLTNDEKIYGSDFKYRLKPMVSDDDVYRLIVENKFDSVSDKDSNIYKNFFYILGFLESITLKGITVQQILDALNELYVVSIPITENDCPQRIFESINATGVKLTAADLIRNYLLMNLDSNTQEAYYYNYWKNIEKLVSNDSKKLELFFRFYLAIKKYELVSKNNIYREFVSWVESQNYDIKTTFEDLIKYAKYYYDILVLDLNQHDKKLKLTLTDYRNIKSDLTLPLYLEFYGLYKDNLIDVDVFNSLIETLNIYMIRRGICDIDSQNISRLFPSILKKINEKCTSNYNKILDILKQELIANNVNTSGSYMPTDKQMMEYLLNANVYGRHTLRTVLVRLELDNNPAPVDVSELSIEHLMPQKPTNDWLTELNTDIDTYNENLHRLGNLTLATKSDNSKMKNLRWDFKNKVLENTNHLNLNVELIKIDKWDINCIDKRTKELILKICDVYPYPDVDLLDTDDGGTEINIAMDIALKKLDKTNLKCLRKDKIYTTKDNKEGYYLSHSKKYKQSDKNVYWFKYKQNYFNEIDQCNQKYYIFVCRGDIVTTVKIPSEFLMNNSVNFNATNNIDGNVDYYHIKMCVYSDGMVSLQLPKPIMREIDITKFVI